MTRVSERFGVWARWWVEDAPLLSGRRVPDSEAALRAGAHYEQRLRACVTPRGDHRKITYGVRSEHGARFLERAFSVCATGRQNGKAVFRFLCDYLSVFLKGLTLASPLAFDTSEQPAPVG